MTPSMKPIIGLTCYTRSGPDWTSDAPSIPQDYIFRNYPRSVERAGGLPVLIPMPADPATADALLDRIDGLLISGGPDAAPHFYGQDPKPGLEEIDYQRDVLELSLIKKTMESGLPTLGICRGSQLMNIAMGGTLYQNIHKERPDGQLHFVNAPKWVNTHKVFIADGTRLHQIVGRGEIMVNSGHHQGICDLAPGLTGSAKAADGLVEAVEKPDHPFMVGVQWHPEGTAEHDPASQALFRAFIESAGKR